MRPMIENIIKKRKVGLHLTAKEEFIYVNYILPYVQLGQVLKNKENILKQVEE